MGILIKGKWVSSDDESVETQREIEQSRKHLRHWMAFDGLGFSGSKEFAAEAGRYHLYYSRACPFAQRAMIFRHLKGLEDIISVSEVEPLMLDEGWTFSEDYPDHLYNVKALHEIYELNDWINPSITLGVYRAGFAKTQADYENASGDVFAALEKLDRRLEDGRYLNGDTLTEADWRLFTTLVRFDAVYAGLFKLDQRELEDYPALLAYVRDLFQHKNVAALVDLEHTRQHYYRSFLSLNPRGIVPLKKVYDFAQPHGRQAAPETIARPQAANTAEILA